MQEREFKASSHDIGGAISSGRITPIDIGTDLDHDEKQ